MTAEEQRIAIAEACGWTEIIPHMGEYVGRLGNHSYGKRIPDYLNDLNAMHEAERVLIKSGKWEAYKIEIWKIFTSSPQFVERETGKLYGADDIHATAAQRAEAFLRTLGKWKE